MVDVAIMSVVISGIVSIISQIQNSRCDRINCCGISCHRKLKDDNSSVENNDIGNDN